MAPRLTASLLFSAAALAQSGADKATFERVCGSCHTISLISDLKSLPEWEETVDSMIERGAKASSVERATVLRWLAHNYSRTNINQAPAQELIEVLDIEPANADRIVARRPYRSNSPTMPA
jgi:DNA uptake protein ComE-like DNA-binding protein